MGCKSGTGSVRILDQTIQRTIIGTGYAYDGAYYMYVETSTSTGILWKRCIYDISLCGYFSTMTNPFFSAWVNMYGASMGSLDISSF